MISLMFNQAKNYDDYDDDDDNNNNLVNHFLTMFTGVLH